MPPAVQDPNQDPYDEEWLYPKDKDQDRWPKKLTFKEPHTHDGHREPKRRKPQAHRGRDD
jgi:hypothetical protein